MDSVDVAVTMPDRQLGQLEGLQQMDDDEEADQETAVHVFNLETVADTIFKRKKTSAVGEFDEDDADDDEGDNPAALAVLEVELDAEDEVNSENMADWLKKLHIRTQHLVGKVTVNGMSRLAATNNVATALTRFKGKVRVDNSGNRAASDGNWDNINSAEEGQSTLPELPTTPTEMSKDVTEKENPSKESAAAAVRSKKDVKPSSKTNKTPKRNLTSPIISSGITKAAASSEIRKTARTMITSHRTTDAGLPAPARTSAAVVSSKTNSKVKTVKNVRSGIKSKVH